MTAQRGLMGERLMLALPMLIGAALLAGAAWAVWAELSFRAGATMTEARIVEMRPSTSRDHDGRTSTVYYPVFDFTVPGGRVVRAVGPVGSGNPCCAVGDVVLVRYDPARPERASQDSFEDSWLLPTVLGAFGTLLCLAGVLVWWVFGPGLPRPALPPGTYARVRADLVGLRTVETQEGRRWIIQARSNLPGFDRMFESEPLPFDPVPQMKGMTQVEVHVDSRPGGITAMELSFLRAPPA